MIQIARVEADTLLYRELANDCYRKMKQFSTEKARVAKDSFKPIFADSSVENEDSSKNTSSKRTTESGKKNKKKNNKHQKLINIDNITACCRCGNFRHYHLHCFYFFLKKTLKNFKSQDEFMKAAEKALKKNTALAEEVRQTLKRVKFEDFNKKN